MLRTGSWLRGSRRDTIRCNNSAFLTLTINRPAGVPAGFAYIIDKYLKIILMDTYEIPGLKDFILPCSLQARTVRGVIFRISAASSVE
jgi:hypothetical protein